MFENARKCPTQYILANKISVNIRNYSERWRMQDSVSKYRKTLKVPRNSGQCQIMLENARKIENATKCKELQKICRKENTANAHFLACPEVRDFVPLYVYLL